jgi:hypothetical protein
MFMNALNPKLAGIAMAISFSVRFSKRSSSSDSATEDFLGMASRFQSLGAVYMSVPDISYA